MSGTSGRWVQHLRPAGPVVRFPVSFPESLAAAAGQIGTDAVDWAVEKAYEMAVRGVGAQAGLGDSESAVDLLRMGAESSLIRVLVGIHAGRLEVTALAPEVPVQLRDFVHRQIPLEESLQAIRTGHEWMAEHLMAACRTLVQPEEYAEQLELIGRTLFAYVNPLTTGVGVVYAEELRLWSEDGRRTRDGLVRALLADGPSDVAAVSASLRYTIHHRHHLGVVVWRDIPVPHDPTDLEGLAEAVLGAMGATSTLLMPVGRFELWGWGSSVRPFARRGERAQQPPNLDLRAARVAVGGAAAGIEGFRATHRQAKRAARVTRLIGSRADRLTDYADVGLLSLLTADLTEAAEFVQRELQELAGPGPALADLRETLLTYLECHRSLQTAAGRLFIARNTVTYRVKRAEGLIGHNLDERETEVRNALLLARALYPERDDASSGGGDLAAIAARESEHGGPA